MATDFEILAGAGGISIMAFIVSPNFKKEVYYGKGTRVGRESTHSPALLCAPLIWRLKEGWFHGLESIRRTYVAGKLHLHTLCAAWSMDSKYLWETRSKVTSCLAALFVSSRLYLCYLVFIHGKVSCSRTLIADESTGQKIRQSVVVTICTRFFLNRSLGRTTIFSPEGTRVFLPICKHLPIIPPYRAIVPKYATSFSCLLVKYCHTDASLDRSLSML